MIDITFHRWEGVCQILNIHGTELFVSDVWKDFVNLCRYGRNLP